MTRIEDLIRESAGLAGFAARQGIALPANDVQELLNAAANAAAIASSGPAQTAFLAAHNATVATLGAQAYASFARCQRAGPIVTSAQMLLAYAAANGKKVEDGIRNPLVAIQASVDEGALAMAQEQELLKAYEGLTVALAPITVETLTASQTVLPGWPPSSWGKLQRWSFGRFLNVLIFIAVLVGTCITLSFYAQGASALKRFNELREVISKGEQALSEKRAVLTSRIAARDLAITRQPADPAALDVAQKALAEAEVSLASAHEDLIAARRERLAIPERMQQWAALPCDASANWFIGLLCAKTDQKQPAAEMPQEADVLVRVEAARTVATRLSDVYLPLLLGWLGAHAFILRNMSKAITERSFAPGSAFNHIVRIGLGALAGLASNWLLTPSTVGGAQWANLPVWALAFVAGYGIELVFAFMDRIIGAFTTKQS